MTTEDLRELIEIDRAAKAFAEDGAYALCASRCNGILPLVTVLKAMGCDMDVIRRSIAASDLRPDVTHLDVAEAMSPKDGG